MPNSNRRLKWIPRILAILFILFISMFALDVFSEDYTIWETLIALFMHLIPSYFLIGATVIAWRWPATGAIVFLILGLVSVIVFKTYAHPISFMVVSLPAFIIGGLFLWGNLNKGVSE